MIGAGAKLYDEYTKMAADFSEYITTTRSRLFLVDIFEVNSSN